MILIRDMKKILSIFYHWSKLYFSFNAQPKIQILNVHPRVVYTRKTDSIEKKNRSLDMDETLHFWPFPLREDLITYTNPINLCKNLSKKGHVWVTQKSSLSGNAATCNFIKCSVHIKRRPWLDVVFLDITDRHSIDVDMV